ncbi:MAG: hypothetical protein ACRDR6_13585 [Pseudonocardiaceae bacterium]
MSSTPASDDVDGFPVVAAEDGSPASELARLGLRPGARLRLVPEPRPAPRTRMAGALAASVSAEAVDALIRGLDEAKGERMARYRAATDQT